MLQIILPCILLYFTILFSVRHAIDPMVNRMSPLILREKREKTDLKRLRSSGALSEGEYRELAQLTNDNQIMRRNQIEFAKCKKSLASLLEDGYISEEVYNVKGEYLKDYFRVRSEDLDLNEII